MPNKRIFVGRALAGVYWKTRYMLLRHHRHRVLSSSHARLLTIANIVVAEYLHAQRDGNPRMTLEMLNSLHHLEDEVQEALKIHKWHAYKGKETS